MKRKFSLAYLTVLGCPPPEMIYIAARTGYDFVSLRPIFMGLPGEPDFSFSKNNGLLRQTKIALADTGIRLLDIELAKIYDGVDVKNYLPAMESAAELGGKHILSSIWSDDKHFALERFLELCELAKPFGLTVELEFVPIASVNNLDGALNVLHEAKQDNAGLMIDVHHFHRSGDKLRDLDQVPTEWFRFLHLCDATKEIPSSIEEMTRILREERLYLGEGGIDVASIVDRIPDIPCSIELPNVLRVQEYGYEEYARRCLHSAKQYFTQHYGSLSQ